MHPSSSTPSQRTHVYVDESKSGDYLLIAGLVIAKDVSRLEQAVRGLLMGKQQQRLHMTKESDQRRRAILARLRDVNVSVDIYVAPTKSAQRTQLEAREDCLSVLLERMVESGMKQLVLDSDETVDVRDRRIIAPVQQRSGEQFVYRHSDAKRDLLLAIPDAVGWAWAKGGAWRSAAEPMIRDIVQL